MFIRVATDIQMDLCSYTGVWAWGGIQFGLQHTCIQFISMPRWSGCIDRYKGEEE